MVDVQSMADLFSKGVELYKNHMPTDKRLNPTLTAGAVALAGLVLSLWGARLLRAMFVVGFMGAGAAIGIKIARVMQIDDLIGLVLGTGLLGVIGFLFYRWWVGMIAGLCAGLLVAAIGGPMILPAEIQKFEDQRLGMSTSEYILPQAGAEQVSQLDKIREYLTQMWRYFRQERTDLVYRTVFAVGLAWLIGLILGVALPRFTTIVGTSLIGTLGLGLGAAILSSIHFPMLWAFVSAKAPWFLGALGVFLLGALSYQARHSRTVVALPKPAVTD